MKEIFIGALPFRAGEQTVLEWVAPYGPVGPVRVHADWVNPTFEPYALVKVEDADRAVLDLDGRKIGATHLRVHEVEENAGR